MAIQAGSIISASDINILINNIKTVCNAYGHGLNYKVYDSYYPNYTNAQVDMHSNIYSRRQGYSYTDTSGGAVCTINGATKLRITVLYQTQNNNDWICIWKGNYPSYTAASNYGSSFTGRLSNVPKILIKRYEVGGDTVTIKFKNNRTSTAPSNSYFGFLVIVEDADIMKAINDNVTGISRSYNLQIHGNVIREAHSLDTSNGGKISRLIFNAGSNAYSKLTKALRMLYLCLMQNPTRKYTTGGLTSNHFDIIYDTNLGNVNSDAFLTNLGGMDPWDCCNHDVGCTADMKRILKPGYRITSGISHEVETGDCCFYDCCDNNCNDGTCIDGAYVAGCDNCCDWDCCDTDCCNTDCCNTDCCDMDCFENSPAFIKPAFFNNLSAVLNNIKNDYCPCVSNVSTSCGTNCSNCCDTDCNCESDDCCYEDCKDGGCDDCCDADDNYYCICDSECSCTRDCCYIDGGSYYCTCDTECQNTECCDSDCCYSDGCPDCCDHNCGCDTDCCDSDECCDTYCSDSTCCNTDNSCSCNYEQK